MNIIYCDLCGRDVTDLVQWRVSLLSTADTYPPLEARVAMCLCPTCAEPAVELVAETAAAVANRTE